MIASGFGPGAWTVSSESDPRFNGSGRVEVMSGGMMPEAARRHVEAKEEELGVERPDDLRCTWMKD